MPLHSTRHPLRRLVALLLLTATGTALATTQHTLERQVPGVHHQRIGMLQVTALFDGIVALGAVIRGATPHFDFVANEATKGLAHVALQHGIPVGFGLLTTDTLEQAIERAGSKAGNKGVEASAAVLETIRVMENL